jgi:hypothetical protein
VPCEGKSPPEPAKQPALSEPAASARERLEAQVGPRPQACPVPHFRRPPRGWRPTTCSARWRWGRSLLFSVRAPVTNGHAQAATHALTVLSSETRSLGLPGSRLVRGRAGVHVPRVLFTVVHLGAARRGAHAAIALDVRQSRRCGERWLGPRRVTLAETARACRPATARWRCGFCVPRAKMLYRPWACRR